MPVETTEGDMIGATHEPAGGRRVVDVAAEDVGAISLHHVGAADRSGERVVEDQLSGLLQRAVGVEEHRRGDPDGWIVESTDQGIDPAGADDDVGVQEAEVVAVGVLDAVLVAAGEAEVVIDGQEPDVGPAGEQQSGSGGRVDRPTIDHDDFVGDRRVTGNSVERSQDDRPGAVGDDDDRNERVTLRRRGGVG